LHNFCVVNVSANGNDYMSEMMRHNYRTDRKPHVVGLMSQQLHATDVFVNLKRYNNQTKNFLKLRHTVIIKNIIVLIFKHNFRLIAKVKS